MRSRLIPFAFRFLNKRLFLPLMRKRYSMWKVCFRWGIFCISLPGTDQSPSSENQTCTAFQTGPENIMRFYIDAVLTNLIKEKGQITAADLSPDGQTMAMISNTSIWIFQNISGEYFFRWGFITSGSTN